MVNQGTADGTNEQNSRIRSEELEAIVKDRGGGQIEKTAMHVARYRVCCKYTLLFA